MRWNRTTGFVFVIVLFLGMMPLIPMVWQAVFGTSPWPMLTDVQGNNHGWSVWVEQGWSWLEAGFISIAIAVIVTGFNVLLAWPAADALVRSNIHGKALIRLWLYAPLFLPAFVPLMGIHFGFVKMGLSDTFSGVVLAHVLPTFPYVLSSLIIGFATLGKTWEEQAGILGARRWQRIFYVVLPMMKPAIMAGCSLSILVSMSQYLITLLIGGGQIQTLPIILFPYLNGGDPGTASQLMLLFVLLCLLVLWGMNHHLTLRMGMNVNRRDE
jgi:putative spermidine/putrescine transport system permease protein